MLGVCLWCVRVNVGVCLACAWGALVSVLACAWRAYVSVLACACRVLGVRPCQCCRVLGVCLWCVRVSVGVCLGCVRVSVGVCLACAWDASVSHLLDRQRCTEGADGLGVLGRLLLDLQQLGRLDERLQRGHRSALLQVPPPQPLLHLTDVVPDTGEQALRLGSTCASLMAAFIITVKSIIVIVITLLKWQGIK